MFSDDSFGLGAVISFRYPRHNYAQARQQMELRRLKVECVRQLTETPLDPLTATLNPFLNRGAVLVTGIDVDKGEHRSFYLERMEDLQVHPLAGDFCVAEVDPPKQIHIRRIHEFHLSLDAADAAIAVLERDLPESEWLAIPLGSIPD